MLLIELLIIGFRKRFFIGISSLDYIYTLGTVFKFGIDIDLWEAQLFDPSSFSYCLLFFAISLMMLLKNFVGISVRWDYDY